MPNADGPDTSHWQTYTGGPIPWPLHALKCSEGKTAGDTTFPARWQMLRDKAVKYRGAYHWLRSDSSMADQATNLTTRIDRLGGLRRGEFIQLDWERTPNLADPIAAMTHEWCDRVQQHYGRPCVIVYSSDWVGGFTAWRKTHPDFPLWYANYVTTVNDKRTDGWSESAKYRADIWQWTSSFTHPSIVGRFDMNHVFNWSTLDRITDQVPPPAPIPPEAPPVVYFYRDSAYQNVWLCGPGGALAVGGEVVKAGTTEGIPMIVDSHPQSLQSALTSSGLRFDDLVPVTP